MTTYAVLPNRSVYPGVSRVLREGEKCAMWKVGYLDAPYREMAEGDVAVFGAWSDGYAIPVRRWKCKKVLLWTSPLAQAEFEELRIVAHVRSLLNQGHLDAVWCGSEDMVDVFGGNTFYAPYPLTVPDLPDPVPPTMVGHASLFCPTHPRKNIAVQLLAAKRAGLTVHLNGQGPAYRDLIGALGVTHYDHGWMAEAEYWRIVASMELGLQWSHEGVESFDFVAWDHLCMNVPVVSSVPWLLDFYLGTDFEYHDNDEIPWDPEEGIKFIRSRDGRFKSLLKKAELFAAGRTSMCVSALLREGVIG